jgi:hypothetical protein
VIEPLTEGRLVDAPDAEGLPSAAPEGDCSSTSGARWIWLRSGAEVTTTDAGRPGARWTRRIEPTPWDRC